MMELLSNPVFVLFLIIATGLMIGNIKVKGISLDASAVIFVALLFGHYGFKVPPLFQKIGLVLFIYSIGIQAGPGFFDSLLKRGRSLIILASIIVVTGCLATIGIVYILDVDINIALGILNGALTSTPGLAAAINATGSPLASIGYGIAYPFGVIGVILFIRLSPNIFKVDIKRQEKLFDKEMKEDYPKIVNKNYIVENENLNDKTLGELKIRTMTDAVISRIMHDGKAFTASVKSRIYKGDVVKAVGTEEALKKVEVLIGNHTNSKMPLDNRYDVQSLMVTNKKIVNKTIRELNIFQNFSVAITRIRRSGIDITPSPNNRLRIGDKLMVAGKVENLDFFAKLVGNKKSVLAQPNVLSIALGIIIGILIGKISIPLFGGKSFTLGVTGGVLLTSLTLGRLGKTGSIIWNMHGNMNKIIRQFGLLFFLAAVGTKAGESLVETVNQYGFKLFAAGMLVTLLPLIVGTIIGKYIFRVNFLSILGTLTGGMTSTPGLSAVEPMTKSNAAHIAYATVYPFAMVILILLTQLLSLL